MTKDTIWLLNAALWLAGYGLWWWLYRLSESALILFFVLVIALVTVAHVIYRLVTGHWAEPAVIQEIEQRPIDDLAILTSEERAASTRSLKRID